MKSQVKLRLSLALSCLSLAALLFLGSINAAAQDLDDATISGKIVDQNGAIVPGAIVTAVLVTENQTRTATTDAEGRYRLVELKPGVYSVRVAANGFANVEQPDLNLLSGDNRQLNYSLTLASVRAETVVIDEDAAPIVDTSRTIVGGTVTQREVEELPNVSRNPLDLVFTLGGVTEEPLSTRDLAQDRGARGQNAPNATPEEAGIFALSGGAAYSNNITIDGLDNNDDRGATFRFQPSIETVAEVQVVTNQFSAEYGRASGGSVNIRTRTGSKNFRGRAFYFFRDESLNANTNRNKARGIARPALQENNPGFTFGGPVPVSYFKNKTFFFTGYEYDNVYEDTIIDTYVPVAQNSRFPLPAPTVSVAAGANGACVAPAISDGGTCIAPYVEGVPTPLRNHIFTARIDHNFTDSHSVTTSYQRGRRRDFRQFSGGSRLAEALVGNSRETDAINFTDNFVFNPKLVNQFRFQRSTLEPAVIADAGLTSPVAIVDLPSAANRGSSLVAGSSTTGSSDRRESRHQFQETLTAIAGAHSLRFGADAQRVNSIFIDRFDTTGTFRFDTANDFVNNRAFRYTQVIGSESAISNTYFGIFAQDDFRLRSDLSLNFGLRYERETIVDDANNFAPRVALAYSPFKNGKGVIRAGFGVFYNRVLLRTIDDFTLGASQITFDTNTITTGADARYPGVANVRQSILDQLSAQFPTALAADSRFIRDFGQTATDFARRIDPNFEIAESYQTNFGFEREIGKGFVVEANLTFNKTAKLAREFNANAISLAKLNQVTGGNFSNFAEYLLSRDFANLPGANGARPFFGGSTSTSANYIRFVLTPFNTTAPGAQSALGTNNADLGGIICINGAQTCANSTRNGIVTPNPNRYYLINLNSVSATNASAPVAASLAVLNQFRPDPTRGQVEQLASIGNSNYRGLTVELRKRYARLGAGFGTSLRAVYTLSSLKDDGIVNTSSAQIVGDFDAEFARSLLDRRHRFAFSGTFDTPIWLAKLRFAPIVRLASSAPFNLSAGGIDRNLDDVNTDRPNFGGDVRDIRFRDSGDPFPQAVFDRLTRATIGTRGGDLPRNAGSGPGQFLFDLNVTRQFDFGEGGRGRAGRFVLRPNVEIDNVFNSTVFSFGTAFINQTDPQATFLVPQRTLRPRQIRLGLRFDF